MKVASVSYRGMVGVILLIVLSARKGSFASTRVGIVSNHATPSRATDGARLMRSATENSVTSTKRRQTDSGQHTRPIAVKRKGTPKVDMREAPKNSTSLPGHNQAAKTSEKKVLAFYFPQYHEVREDHPKALTRQDLDRIIHHIL